MWTKNLSLLNKLAVMFLLKFEELLNSGKLALNEKHALKTAYIQLWVDVLSPNL